MSDHDHERTAEQMVDEPLPDPSAESRDGDTPVVTPELLGIELSDDPREAIEMLLGELFVAQQRADGYLDQLQRKAAEFENYRKRSLREHAAIRELGSERLASALLPALDSFDAALALPADTEAEQRLLAGMKGTYAQLIDALAREGFEVLPGVGAPFDPTIHEAVSSPPEAAQPLVVSHELRRGYRLKNKVLRATLVALAEGEDLSAQDEPKDQVGNES